MLGTDKELAAGLQSKAMHCAVLALQSGCCGSSCPAYAASAPLQGTCCVHRLLGMTLTTPTSQMQHLRTVRGHRAAVYCIQFSRSGSLIVTGSDDTNVKVHKLCTQPEHLPL